MIFWFAVTLAGCPRYCRCDRALFSLASAAAVTGNHKAQLTLPLRTGNGGSWDICLSIISAMRRSDNAPTSAIAGRYYPPPLPPARHGSCPGDHLVFTRAKTSGLSDTALASTNNTSAARRSCVRHAPITCGWQRAGNRILHLFTVVV